MKRGFTLVEMLITITVFMIFMGIVLQSTVLILTSQKETDAYRMFAAEIREFDERLQTLLKDGTLDYGCYENEPACLDQRFLPEKTLLAIRTPSGAERTLIRFHPDKKNISIETQTWNGTWSRGKEEFLMSESTIETLRFLIYPEKHPDSDITKDELQFQPKITLAFSGKPKQQRKKIGLFHFQSSFSLRNL